MKQLIMKDSTYIKEIGVEYSNPARKVQKVTEGGGWKITGRKQDVGKLNHFGYQILPKMLQEWCKGHNLQTERIGMTTGMRKVSEMKNVSSLELVDILRGGSERSNIQERIKTPRTRNAMIRKKQGEHEDWGVREAIAEIKQMIRNMESAVTKKMKAMEVKVNAVANQKDL